LNATENHHEKEIDELSWVLLCFSLNHFKIKVEDDPHGHFTGLLALTVPFVFCKLIKWEICLS